MLLHPFLVTSSQASFVSLQMTFFDAWQMTDVSPSTSSSSTTTHNIFSFFSNSYFKTFPTALSIPLVVCSCRKIPLKGHFKEFGNFNRSNRSNDVKLCLMGANNVTNYFSQIWISFWVYLLIGIWQNIEPTLAIFYAFWQIVIARKGQLLKNIPGIWSHRSWFWENITIFTSELFFVQIGSVKEKITGPVVNVIKVFRVRLYL